MTNIKLFYKMALLCICMVFCITMFSFVSYAKEGTTQVTTRIDPRMTYIAGYSTELVISDTGVATITGQVRGKTGVTQAYVNVTLQKLVLGKWIDVEDWEDSRSGRNAFVSETYQVNRGTYRVVMTCSANTETKTATSAQRTY